MYTAEKIAVITKGILQGNGANEISYLSADSRKIAFPASTLFFAIKKERRNGHQFLAEVYELGVRCFVISENIPIDSFPGATFIMVEDTMLALQELAAYHRLQYKLLVIGITGSNGKTIVKEWLNQLLQPDKIIVRSPKSYNSQLGVPLSVWQINEVHQLGIFEAGISLPGEMSALQNIIQPHIGILTNIGPAHAGGFINDRQKLMEKLELFWNAQILICSFDHPMIRRVVSDSDIPVFSWGRSHDCDIILISIHKGERQSEIEISFNDLQIETPLQKKHRFLLPFTDDASIENAMHCIALMRWLFITPEIIAGRLLLLQPVEMRLEWKKAIHNCYVLNDSYSNDLASLIIALDYIKQQKRGSRTTIILSDFAEAYKEVKDIAQLYTQVIGLLIEHKINRLIAVGEKLPTYTGKMEALGIQVQSYSSTGALLEDLAELAFNNETILVKGARVYGLERVVAFLEQQSHQTVLEINLTALANNLQQYRQLLQPSVKIMVMVKAFGYGSGDAEVAKLLQFNKVDYLAVAYADEGVALRKAGIHLPVMVMNPEPASFAAIENNNLEPEIFSFEILESFSRYCKIQGISQYPIHIKLDTGMHRLGFGMDQVEALSDLLANQNLLLVKTVFTHLAASENPLLDDFTNQQAALFTIACGLLENKLQYGFLKHAANTAAIRRHPDKHFDMVRLGIGMYGVDSPDMNLQVVTTLKTTVAQVKKIKAGETVGYNRMGRVTTDSTIATVRIGYADGYRRELGNGVGKILVNGKPAPVIGNICMDMTMVDITHSGKVQPGDAVEIFGENIPIEEVAKNCQTITYEIMTGISQRVKRIYLQE